MNDNITQPQQSTGNQDIQPGATTGQKKVEIYSTPSCHFCDLAKAFFKENGVSYAEHNVALDLEKRKEMVSMTGQMGVPVVVIGDDVMVGFQEDKFKELLGINA